MGVPKFYRWISERYPCLSEIIKDYQIPDFDNLYLDMNGIIHNCSHPDDDNPHFRITEQQIFEDIFHYIEVLFRMIKPKKIFFMAIDGVAPRAKMNQQRGRRFRSALEAITKEKEAVSKGEVLPTEARFDSNCITPGTVFMDKLHQQLKYFVVKKVSEDPLWQIPKIIYSGHETPGEGEHKIMDFIRYERAKSDHNPETRHCLYGLDADLIFLGLSTHEPNFSLLREEVVFGNPKNSSNKRITQPEYITFHLLHLSILRDYIDLEFSCIKKDTHMNFDYDIEAIIDDWILMGFLVGNDFVPNLPGLHIHHNALPSIWSSYKKVLPTITGYINEGGKLNLERFEKLMSSLVSIDIETFSEELIGMKWLEDKKAESIMGPRPTNVPPPKEFINYFDPLNEETIEEFELEPTINQTLSEESTENHNNDIVENGMTTNGIKEMVLPLETYGDQLTEEDALQFRDLKDNYYRAKFGYKTITSEVLQEHTYEWIRAIQWILSYYFDGCVSWSWFYPYHYCPYLSDIRNFGHLKLEFDLSRPFLPFEQLMAVLPPLSKDLLPKAFQYLMTDTTSSILDFYPEHFEQDLNGKQQAWEAVVVIPFIEEERLLSAMTPRYSYLTADEKRRNVHAPALSHHFSKIRSPNSYPSSLPGVFPDILINHCFREEIPIDEYRIPRSSVVYGLLPGIRSDIFTPGFSRLHHLKFTTEFKAGQVKVFQQFSRYENMMLSLEKPTEEPDLWKVAEEIIGSRIFINWPHFTEALVIAVHNENTRIFSMENNPSLKERLQVESEFASKLKTGAKNCHGVTLIDEVQPPSVCTFWPKKANEFADRYKCRWGVHIGPTFITVDARPYLGRKYITLPNGKVFNEKQWDKEFHQYAYQVVVPGEILADYEESFCEYRSLSDLFTEGTMVFMLTNPNYGCLGKVVKVVDNKIVAKIDIAPDIDIDDLRSKFSRDADAAEVNFATADNDDSYMNVYILSQKLGLQTGLVARITGTIFVSRNTREDYDSESVSRDKVNVGLNLKSNRRKQYVSGYSRKDEHGKWIYSGRVQKILKEYMLKFPTLFQQLSYNINDDVFFADELFPDSNEGETLDDVVKYIRELPCMNKELLTDSSFSGYVEEEIKVIEKEIDQKYNEIRDSRNPRMIKLHVKPDQLLRIDEDSSRLVPDDNATFQLMDRVVNVRPGFSVPLGLRGTVVGIRVADNSLDNKYDVLWDEKFVGGLSIKGCSLGRGYQVPLYSLINLSYGVRWQFGVNKLPISRDSPLIRPNARERLHKKNSNIPPLMSVLLKNDEKSKVNDEKPITCKSESTVNPVNEFSAIWSQLASSSKSSNSNSMSSQLMNQLGNLDIRSPHVSSLTVTQSHQPINFQLNSNTNAHPSIENNHTGMSINQLSYLQANPQFSNNKQSTTVGSTKTSDAETIPLLKHLQSLASTSTTPRSLYEPPTVSSTCSEVTISRTSSTAPNLSTIAKSDFSKLLTSLQSTETHISQKDDEVEKTASEDIPSTRTSSQTKRGQLNTSRNDDGTAMNSTNTSGSTVKKQFSQQDVPGALLSRALRDALKPGNMTSSQSNDQYPSPVPSHDRKISIIGSATLCRPPESFCKLEQFCLSHGWALPTAELVPTINRQDVQIRVHIYPEGARNESTFFNGVAADTHYDALNTASRKALLHFNALDAEPFPVYYPPGRPRSRNSGLTVRQRESSSSVSPKDPARGSIGAPQAPSIPPPSSWISPGQQFDEGISQPFPYYQRPSYQQRGFHQQKNLQNHYYSEYNDDSNFPIHRSTQNNHAQRGYNYNYHHLPYNNAQGASHSAMQNYNHPVPYVTPQFIPPQVLRKQISHDHHHVQGNAVENSSLHYRGDIAAAQSSPALLFSTVSSNKSHSAVNNQSNFSSHGIARSMPTRVLTNEVERSNVPPSTTASSDNLRLVSTQPGEGEKLLKLLLHGSEKNETTFPSSSIAMKKVQSGESIASGNRKQRSGDSVRKGNSFSSMGKFDNEGGVDVNRTSAAYISKSANRSLSSKDKNTNVVTTAAISDGITVKSKRSAQRKSKLAINFGSTPKK